MNGGGDPRLWPRLIVPEPDRRPWPTLGFEVVDWIEAYMVHGPGDLLGEDVHLTDEALLFLLRVYEIYPRGHEFEGRRRFKREVYSRRKGTAKTELAAFIACAEMDPRGPVRFDGWRRRGRGWVPVGRPVRDPYIPMVAVTEEQTEDLAYGAVKAILQHNRCPLVNEYDAGEEKTTHITAPGVIQPLASAPDARDGARTSFQHVDEPHRFKSPRLKGSHSTMLQNIPKRREADAHTLETTTMYEVGEGSVAEESHKYALAIAESRVRDPELLFDHRQASLEWEIYNPDGSVNERELRAAVEEASGDALEWTDVRAVMGQFTDPQIGESKARRFWLNQAWTGERTWINPRAWAARADKVDVAARAAIVLGFRGAQDNHEASLVACTAGGYVFELQVWEPDDETDLAYQVPRDEVQAKIEEAFRDYRVGRFAFDPLGWVDQGDGWVDTYGERVAAAMKTTRSPSVWAEDCDRFYAAVTTENEGAQLSHDGSPVIARHLTNAKSKRIGASVEVEGRVVERRYIVASASPTSGAFAAVIAYSQHRVLAEVSSGRAHVFF